MAKQVRTTATKTAKRTTMKTAKDTTKKTATAKAAPPRKTVTKSRSKVMPTEDQIRARAFEIYQRRNDDPGDAHSDWAQAERELQAELSK